MKCLVCGAALRSVTTDLPLKVSDRTVVIVRNAPALQCAGCMEYLLDDVVMAKIDELLSWVASSMELAIVAFAARRS